jgi:hypothetical protein
VKILFRDITATRNGSLAPFIELVLNDISAINGVDVNFDGDGNVLEGEDVLDDEPNLNTHGIDDIPVDLDMRIKKIRSLVLRFNARKERKKFKSLVNI